MWSTIKNIEMVETPIVLLNLMLYALAWRLLVDDNRLNE
jgi:hypothetical protein